MSEQRFHVVWEIDIYAETPHEAARQAWEAMRDELSVANYFEVYDQDGNKTNVDLLESDNDLHI